jgi:RNA-directed DNA polymerase
MKKSYRKDAANHPDPESCGTGRKTRHEALTGADAGEVSSREIPQSGTPTLLSEAEGNTSVNAKASSPAVPRGRRPSARIETSGAGTGRPHASSKSDDSLKRPTKAISQSVGMCGHGESDESVVSKKPANKIQKHYLDFSEAELVEKRDSIKKNPGQRSTSRTQSRKYEVSPELEGVRQNAHKNKKMKFTALLHHINEGSLLRAFYRLEPKAAPGIDGVVWQQYRVNLDANLKGLCDRIHRGGFRAKPSRRVYIPKTDGRLRPLGVAALEDKIVQAAVVEILNSIYEADFLGFSYGFRPGRGAHDALDALAVGIHRRKVNWVLDADIRGFFDNISHEWMTKFLQHRIADRRLLRLIGKWLRAGVIEQDQWKAAEAGTPQGATISPLLANIYLHYVLDTWAHHWRQRQARGTVILVRYADDFVMGFEHREEAEQLLHLLRLRMAKFGLELHGEKTRLIRFGRFAAAKRVRQGQGKPETFSFLGFTHISGQAQSGRFLLIRHTMSKRLRAKLSDIKAELQRRRHRPLGAQGEWLRAVLRGYYRYYGVPTNIHAMAQFRTELARGWYRSLRRRSQKRRLTWDRMSKYVNRWLPAAHICHAWPWERFDARTQDKSRVQ